MKTQEIIISNAGQIGAFNNNYKGYLIHHDALCRALKVPKNHFIMHIFDNDDYINVLIKSRDAISIQDGLVIINNKYKVKTLIRDRELLAEHCGMYANDFYAEVRVRVQGNFFMAVRGCIQSSLSALNRSNCYFWFVDHSDWNTKKITPIETRIL